MFYNTTDECLWILDPDPLHFRPFKGKISDKSIKL